MCGNLAFDERYTVKHPAYFEEGHYFCWVDYDLDSLTDFVAQVATRWLIDVHEEPPQGPPR